MKLVSAGCLFYFVAVTEDDDLEGTWISKYMEKHPPDEDDGFHYLMGVYWAITTVQIAQH